MTIAIPPRWSKGRGKTLVPTPRQATLWPPETPG